MSRQADNSQVRDVDERFAGIARLYGRQGYDIIRRLHVCVIGLGGVGSWAVEALARSGVAKITLIDYDTVAPGNINRQLAATGSTLGEKKHRVLQQRILDIHPHCEVEVIDDFITDRNLWEHLDPARGYDYVIDAIDSIGYKAAVIYFCRRNKIPVITTGGAGGLIDPGKIEVRDLSRTCHDALAAKVRARLRDEYGFSKNPKRYFGVECVFSTEHPVYPKADGSVSMEKPGIHGVHLDCRFGYGAASFVTASFGFRAVARVIEKTIRRRTSQS